jgi:hypothetical protein
MRRNALLQEGNQNDRFDARKPAELLQNNQLRSVYHGNHGLRTLKELVRSYLTITKDLSRVMTRVKAIYRSWAILLHSFAYNLVNLFRLQLPLSMRSAQIETLRIQLFKIGARIRQTARCVRMHLASGWPFQDLFQAASLCNSS